MLKLSLCLLAYNEAVSLRTLIPLSLSELRESSVQDFELLVIDDASSDETSDIALQFAKDHPEVRLVRHEENRGYAGATATALDCARGEIVVVMDGDGQHPPRQALDVFESMERHKVAVALPIRSSRAESFRRKVASFVLTLEARLLLKFPQTDINGGIKGIRKDVSELIRIRHFVNLVNPEIWVRVQEVNLSYIFVQVDQLARLDGTQSRVIQKPWTQLMEVTHYMLVLRKELGNG